MEFQSSPHRGPRWNSSETSSDDENQIGPTPGEGQRRRELEQQRQHDEVASRKSTGSSTTRTEGVSSSDEDDDDGESASLDLLMDRKGPPFGGLPTSSSRIPPSASSATARGHDSSGSTTASEATVGNGAGHNSDSSTCSDDSFSVGPSRRRCGKAKRQMLPNRDSDCSSFAHAPASSVPAPFLASRSRALRTSPPQRGVDVDEVEVMLTGPGGDNKERGKGKGKATPEILAATAAARVAASSTTASLASPERQVSGNSSRRTGKRKRGFGALGPRSSSFSSPVLLRDSPVRGSSHGRQQRDSTPILSGIDRRGEGGLEPSSSDAVGHKRTAIIRRRGERVNHNTSAPGGQGKERLPGTPSTAAVSSPPRLAASATPRLAARTAPAAAPFSSASCPDVLDLSSAPPREVIEVLDDSTSTHGAPLSQPSSWVSGGAPGQAQSGAGGESVGGGGGLERGACSSRCLLGAAGATVARAPAPPRVPGAARNRWREPAVASSRSSADGAAAPGNAAIVVDEDDDDGTAERARQQRRRRRRRLAAAADAATAGGGWAGRGMGSATAAAVARQKQRPNSSRDHLAAARLQREENREQERRDAEMARRLQSEERRSGGAAGALSGMSDYVGMLDSSASAFWDQAGGALQGVPASGGSSGAGDTASAAGGRAGVRVGASRSLSSGRSRGGSSPARPGARGSTGTARGRSGGSVASQWGGNSAAVNLARHHQSFSHAALQMMALLTQHHGHGNLAGLMGGMPGGADGTGLAALQGRELTSADYQQLLALDEAGGGTRAKKGLSPSEVAMLPQQTGNGSGPMEQCCICMEDMKSRQSITRLPACLHTFHSKCIKKWLEVKPCCPVDKTTVSVSNSA